MINQLLQQIKNCTLCATHLPAGVNPIVAASADSKILIIGQAPGLVVHRTHIPWNDQSGDNLRNWLGVDKEIFYDTHQIALMPMGFCYPGKGKSGDLPPRPECAPLWHQKVLNALSAIQMIILIGQYAQHYYLKEKAGNTVTETVRQFRDYLPGYFPLPHPSPRNNIWQAKNKWFAADVLPVLKEQVKTILA